MKTQAPIVIHEPAIDEYLRKRLMPVEGVIPQLPRTDMYGNSIPAGSVGGDLFEYINFQQRYNIDARIARALQLSEEYLEPFANGQRPQNMADEHVQWLRSNSAPGDPPEAEYEERKAPNNAKSPTTCASYTRRQAFSWWTLKGMDLFRQKLHREYTIRFTLSCSPNLTTMVRLRRS
jgi:hypothetical protein